MEQFTLSKLNNSIDNFWTAHYLCDDDEDLKEFASKDVASFPQG